MFTKSDLAVHEKHELPNANTLLANVLKIYLDFCYFLCFSPFRLVFDRTRNSFRVQSWLPQRLLCAISSFLCSFWLLRTFTSVVERGLGRNPTMYFNIASSITGLILKSCVVKKFWRNQSDFETLVNVLVQPEPPFFTGVNTKYCMFLTRNKIRLLCSLYTVIMLITVATGIGIYNHNDHVLDLSISWWAERMVENSRRVYLFTSVRNSTELTSVGNVFLLMAGSIGFFQRHLMGFFGDLYFMIFTLTLWTPAFLLGKKLTENAEMNLDWTQVQMYTQVIQEISQLVNNLASSVVTCFLVEVVVFYSTSFGDVFNGSEKGLMWNKCIRMTFFGMSTCTILLLAANICHQVKFITAVHTLLRFLGAFT